MPEEIYGYKKPARPELSISVFFPAYNEAENLPDTLYAVEQVLRRITNRYEIIVVDDGSSDDTKNVVERIQVFSPAIRLIRHRENQGYGAALVAGIRAARYEWIFFTDADLQFRLDELEMLVEHVPAYDAVIGYRAPRRDPFMRLVNAKGWNFLNRAFFDLRVRDIDCAFKLFRRDLVAHLPIKSRGAMISAEILIRLSRMGVFFREVPVTHLPRTRGNPTGAKPAVILRALREMISLYRSDLGSANAPIVQAGKFGIIGVLNTIIDVSGYYLLTRFAVFFTEHIFSAKVLSFTLGTISSFMLNRRYTFAMKTRLSFAEFMKFYSTVGAGLLINVTSLYLLTTYAGMYDLAAVVISTLLTFIWSFLLSKFWVFTSTSSRTQPDSRQKLQVPSRMSPRHI